MPTGHDYPEYLTSESLDDRHKAIIEFVADFRERLEYGPSAHEIAEGTTIPLGSVKNMVERLIRSGYLVRPINVYRALRTARGDEHLVALQAAWLARVRALPVEEKKALLEAADKLRHELRAEVGEGVPA
jgi:hypothetical protein